MSIKNGNWLRQCAAWLAGISVFVSIHAKALDVIDPTGVNYIGVSASSEYSASYSAAKLFDKDVTGVSLGAVLTGDSQFATAGQATVYVAFQLDQVYTGIGSIFYAERSSGSPTVDKMQRISIWASSTTPFTAANPGTSPDSVVSITNMTGSQWTEYALNTPISGQYFLLFMEQTNAPTQGNPGGREFRLGKNLGAPATIVTPPADKTVYVGGTARFSAVVSGTAPLVCTWSHGGSPLANGGRISGADTANLVISAAASGDSGAYTFTVSNAYGTNSASASLALIAAPTEAAEAAVIANGPLAFWQLNEPNLSATAFDYVGGFNGTYGATSISGVAGPRPPGFPGFSSANTALQTASYDGTSPATVPAPQVSNTNSVTILAWIYQDSASTPQQPYTGIVYCRGGTTSAGLIFANDGSKLGYQWNGTRYAFDSGLVVPTNQWTLVALVYTTNFTTLYMGTTNGVVLSAIDSHPQVGQTFGVNMKIGMDTDVGETTRTFAGLIDDVAFFNRALSSDEISALYATATGITPRVQITGQSPTSVTAFMGDSISLTVQVSGLTPAYQWYKQAAPIAGGTSSTYTIHNTTSSDAGDYYVIVTNAYNSVTSAVITVTVPPYVLRPIGPSGAIYTDVSWSSAYPDPAYTGVGMFDADMTGVLLGADLSGAAGGNEWAEDGVANLLAPAYLAFQVDKSYSVDAIFYAQRSRGQIAGADQITQISIWASTSTPFTAADPGTIPDAVVPNIAQNGAIWNRYLLPATISGKYFVIKVEQDPTVPNSNIGGTEFRLGLKITPVPLTYSTSPSGLTLNWPEGAVLQQADNVPGPWTIATGVTSGVAIPMTAPQKFYRIQY